MNEELGDLKYLAFSLEGVSKALQAIIDQETKKRSKNECKYLIKSVEKFDNDIFNHEKDIFTCLQNEAQNITCDIDGKNQLAELVDIFNNAINETNNNAAEKEEELAIIKGQLETFENKENEDTTLTKT